MQVRAIVIAAGASLAAVVMLYAMMRPHPALSDAELGVRAAEAKPRWENYDEDVKAMMGAAAVAHWHGAPESVEQHGAEIRVTFRLRGQWTELQAAMPVLLETPALEHVLAASATGEGELRTYRFALASDEPLPWIEVRYPNKQQRLPLNAAGAWDLQ